VVTLNLVTLETPGEMFIGSFQTLKVEFDDSDIDWDELIFEIREGSKGGRISTAQQGRMPDGEAEVTLLAGSHRGQYHLDVYHQSDPNTRVAAQSYRVSVHSKGPQDLSKAEEGPPVWVTASHDAGSFAPNKYGIEEKQLQTGDHEVLVLFASFAGSNEKIVDGDFIESKSELYDFYKKIINGKNGGFDDEVLGIDDISLSSFYDESSGGRLNVDGTIHEEVFQVMKFQSNFAGRSYTPGRKTFGFRPSFRNDVDRSLVSKYHSGGGNVHDFDSVIFAIPHIDRWNNCPKGPNLTDEDSDAFEQCFGEVVQCNSDTPSQDCVSTCGNGKLERESDGWVPPDNQATGEYCDDGDDDNFDGCNNNCRPGWRYIAPSAHKDTIKLPDPSSSKTKDMPFIMSPAANELTSGGSQSADNDGDGEIFEYPTDSIGSTVALLSHEFGHVLGLNDTYGSSFARTMGKYDLMARGGRDLPQMSLSHRVALNWVDESALATFDLDNQFNATKTLGVANEITNGDVPTTGRHPGVQIKLADRWFLFAEYRRGEDHHIADQDNTPLPQQPNKGVVSFTNLMANPGESTEVRRHVNYPASATNTQDTRAMPSGLAFTRPRVRHGNKLEIEHENELDRDPSEASLKVINDSSSVDCNEQDCDSIGDVFSMRKWGSGDEDYGRWQSPDIEVVNALNQGTAKGQDHWNVPAPHIKNEIRATFENRTNTSRAATIDFYTKVFNIGGPLETPKVEYLGSAGPRLASPGNNTFTMDWYPHNPDGDQRAAHECLMVEIRPFEGNNSDEYESVTANNSAQSNYTQFRHPSEVASSCDNDDTDCSDFDSTQNSLTGESETKTTAVQNAQSFGSLRAKNRTTVTIKNPLDDREAIFNIHAENTNPDFVNYLEASWVRLAPGEFRDIGVSMEYTGNFRSEWDDSMEERPTNRLNVSAELVRPTNADVDPGTMGGVTIQGKPELPVEFTRVTGMFTRSEGNVRGRLIDPETDQQIDSGEVLLAVYYEGDDHPQTRKTVPVSSSSDFSFDISFTPKDEKRVSHYVLYYKGSLPYGPHLYESGG